MNTFFTILSAIRTCGGGSSSHTSLCGSWFSDIQLRRCAIWIHQPQLPAIRKYYQLAIIITLFLSASLIGVLWIRNVPCRTTPWMKLAVPPLSVLQVALVILGTLISAGTNSSSMNFCWDSLPTGSECSTVWTWMLSGTTGLVERYRVRSTRCSASITLKSACQNLTYMCSLTHDRYFVNDDRSWAILTYDPFRVTCSSIPQSYS